MVLLLSGCGVTQTFQHGYIVPEHALEQIPLGASQEQVLIVLGTPSTVATISGEVFYYISQRSERTSFLPQTEVDRRVVAVYFDKGRRVERIANYGVKDGRVLRLANDALRRSGTQLPHVRVQGHQPPWQLEQVPLSCSKIGKGDRRDSQCAIAASNNNATILVILIIGLTAGPAVSL